MSVEIANESGVQVDEATLADLCRYVLDELRINPLADLSVLAVDAATMERLHVQWMDEEGPTDVLSFPMDELRPEADGSVSPAGLLGDVVLCPEVAQRQAAAAGHSFAEELYLLCAHGILHLLGYDHAEPEDEREMFGLQRRLLAGWRGGETTK